MTSQRAASKPMERRVGMAGVFAICTGAMFSSGFFLLPGLAADEAGPSLPLAYLAAGVLVLPALLSLAELSSAMPRAGGPYIFLTRSLGPTAGTIGALGKYVQLLFKGAFAFVGVGAYLSLVVEVPIRPVALALVVAFTAVNLVGVGATTRIELVLVAALLVVLTAFTLAGGVEVARLDAGMLADRFDPLLPFGGGGFLAAVALVFVSYAGVGQVASVSEEVREPGRSIPWGMLAALVTATIFYVVGTAIMVALVAPDDLRDDPAPVATAAEQFTAVGFPIWVIVVAALAAFASTGNAAILSAARYPLAMAREHQLWSRFATVDRRGVPRVAVLVTGTLLAALILLFDVENIAKLASAFLLLVFIGSCLALIVFRESGSEEYQPTFRAPLYPWSPVVGCGVYLLLIVQSGGQAVMFVALLVVGALAWRRVVSQGQTRRSAAVHQWFGRLAEQARPSPDDHASWLPPAARLYDDIVQRAIVIDTEPGDDLEGIAVRAAAALAERVGGDEQSLAEGLLDGIHRWAVPVNGGVVISPVRLEGIGQPEIVLARPDDVEVAGRHLDGVVFVVDDDQHSGRLLDLVTQITAATHRPGFAEAWRAARRPEEFRTSLVPQVRTISRTLDGQRDPLVGTRVRDADLPPRTLVVLIRRGGASVIPHGDVEFEDGDDVTFVVGADQIGALEQRFPRQH